MKAKNLRLALAASRGGRMLLHLVCAWRDHQWSWHWAGIRREFSR